MASTPPPASPSRGRPRRRRRSSRKQWQWGLLSSPQVGRWVGFAMIALTVFYVVNAFSQVRLAANAYGVLTRDVSPPEVRYLLGTPARVDPATGNWYYVQGPAQTVVSFGGPGGSVDRVACLDPQRTAFACASTMGFGVGSEEPDIWYRLGAPSRQSFHGDRKTIVYTDLGLAFELERMEVIGVEMLPRNDRLSYLGRFFRSLVP